MSIEELRAMLRQATGGQVIDHTGLAGKFDINLRWRPDDSDADNPDLFAAIQEQLGLRLKPGKGSVEMLIVDHAERTPTEN